MSPRDRALALTEAEYARRAAARITTFLQRTDLSPACRDVAVWQRSEYLAVVDRIEDQLHPLAYAMRARQQMAEDAELAFGPAEA